MGKSANKGLRTAGLSVTRYSNGDGVPKSAHLLETGAGPISLFVPYLSVPEVPISATTVITNGEEQVWLGRNELLKSL